MCVSYVRIELPLAARSGGPDCLVRVSSPVAGMTLTSAPVSTRNCRLETALQTKSRPLFWPATVAITGDRPFRFPAKSKVVRLSALPGCLPEPAVVITQTVVGGRRGGLGFCFLLPNRGAALYGVDRLHIPTAPEGVGSSS